MPKIIIEHMDPRLWKWSLMEYKHVSDFIGRENLVFTNIKGEKAREKLSKLGKVCKDSIKDMKLNSACVLDPNAEIKLTPDERFDYLILGGILGDFPRKKRTKKELTNKLNYPSRNLGRGQMSTNTAAIVAWKIAKGIPLEKMRFRRLVIKAGKNEEIILPYRYLFEGGKPVLPQGYIEMAKKLY